MTTARFGFDRIAQISVNAHDLDRAVAFYRDVLGLRLLFQVPRMAFFDCGGVRLMVALAEKPEFDHPASVIYYNVGDITAAHAALREKGVAFEAEPHVVAKLASSDLWLAFFRDTEGNLLSLSSEVARS